MCLENYRTKIYDYFQTSNKCHEFFFLPENEERYSSYYTSMFLIQDTAEGLSAHRTKGFAVDPLISYIEFWGVMQAIFIQQEAISQLYMSVTNNKLVTSSLKKWQMVRELRHVCAGHPAKKSIPKTKPLTRTFMGRNFGGYNSLIYETWQSPDVISHPEINLGRYITDYESEASDVLKTILIHMKEKWVD